jgi:hypothetical protein
MIGIIPLVENFPKKNEDDGWYSIHFENLDDCVQEVKAFFKKEYQVR